MATKKATKETGAEETFETPTTEASVILPDTKTADDVNAPVAADLEKVDLSQRSGTANDANIAPKMVNYDNGTISYEGLETQILTHPNIMQGAIEGDNADPSKLVRMENIEIPVVARGVRITDERMKKAQFQAYMDDLKKNRPSVYAEREEDLIKQRDAAPE